MPVMDDAAVHSLPDDPQLLKTLLIERVQLLGLRENRIAELELDKLRLQQQLMVAMKKLYGPRGDRLASTGDVAQLLLDFAKELEARPVDPADLPADTDLRQVEPTTVRRVKRRRGRRDLSADEFDHLPVVRREHDLKDADKPCACCNQPRVKIGEETTWQIECMPGYFYRLEHVQFKYACCWASCRMPIFARHCAATPLTDRTGGCWMPITTRWATLGATVKVVKVQRARAGRHLRWNT